MSFHHLKFLHCFQERIGSLLVWHSTLVWIFSLVPVELITLVARSNIYQLGLQSIWSQTKVTRVQNLNEFPQCKAFSSRNCFSIIVYVTTQYSSSIKECMQVGWQKPALKRHVDFLACSPCMYDEFIMIYYFTISFYIFVINFKFLIEVFIIHLVFPIVIKYFITNCIF